VHLTAIVADIWLKFMQEFVVAALLEGAINDCSSRRCILFLSRTIYNCCQMHSKRSLTDWSDLFLQSYSRFRLGQFLKAILQNWCGSTFYSLSN